MTTQELVQEIEKVTVQIDEQIRRRRNGEAGPGTLGELETISHELSKLMGSLRENNVPAPSHRALASARIVTDTWDLKEPLGEEICRIAYLYRHELTEALPD